jgi:hypothetical protein
MRRKMAWGISALLLLTSCAGNGTEQPVYCCEAYFGNIPYKNRAFNIDHAPAFWIAFADSQSEEAKEYIHTLIEQVTDSFSY